MVFPLVTGSLKITFVHVDDEGFYECVAENSVGVAYSDPAYLYVEGKLNQ